MKNWMHLSKQLCSVAVVTVLALSIAGCPATTPPTGDPPPGQTLDADGDGVIDADDNCADTPEGATVGTDGCEIPAVVIEDDDSDGVANDDDDCPNPPTGELANASGCAASERDTDGDGVNDDADQCPSTPSTVTIDASGCPVGDPEAEDGDGDGVGDDIDQCLSTPARATVDANGCSDTERDTDGDGVMDADDTCSETPDGETVNGDGCSASQLGTPGGGGPGGPTAVCGNGSVEAGEGCDDGNTNSGDGCSSVCQAEVAGPTNNSCGSPAIAEDGTQDFSTIGATTDGPDEPAMCDFFGRTQVEADVWYTYTATCSGEVVVSLCGSNFDTKMAVYDGVGCPSNAAMACSDDDCGTAKGNIESRVSFQAAQGDEYMIRIGGFNSAQGDGGRLTITCGASACGTTANDCFGAATDGSSGCDDATCCDTVCAVDQYCCDVAWDSFCASEAEGLCTAGWPTCQVGIGSCQIPRENGGCGTVDCCNTVCDEDPFCCINGWDDNCVNGANSTCFLTCGARSGDCFTGHEDAGCNAVSCCELVCPDDPFCCETVWDADCATKANEVCR